MLRLLDIAATSGRYVVQAAYMNYLHIYLFRLLTRIAAIYRLGGKPGGVAPIAKDDRVTSISGATQFGKHGISCEQAPTRVRSPLPSFV